MSSAPLPTKYVRVIDDRIMVETEAKTFALTVGPESQTFQNVTANSQNSLQPSFVIQPSTFNVGPSRRIIYNMGGTIVIQGTNLDQLVATNRIAWRQFPLINGMTNIQLQMNNFTFNWGNPQQWVNTLFRKGLTSKALGGVLSIANVAPDLHNDYQYDLGTTGVFAPAGATPYSNYQSQSRTLGMTNFALTAGNTVLTITFNLLEPVPISPLEYAKVGRRSMFGVNMMQLTCTFGNVHRMLSIALGGTTATVNQVTLNPTSQFLTFNQVTADTVDLVPDRPYLYGYSDILTYTTPMQANLPIAAGSVVAGSSGTIDLQIVPSHVFVTCIPSDADRNNPQQSIPDIMCPLQSISIQYGAAAGLLSTAGPPEFFNMNQRNNNEFPYWAANYLPLVGSASTGAVPYGSGNALLIDVAKDLSLPKGISPGMTYRTQLQVTSATFINNSTIAWTNQMQMLVIVLTPAVLTNQQGQSNITRGVPLTPAEIQSTLPPEITTTAASELEEMGKNGGFGGRPHTAFGRFLKGLGSVLNPVLDVASMFVPGVSTAAKVAHIVTGSGVDGGCGRGGAYLGGNAGAADDDDSEMRGAAKRRRNGLLRAIGK